MTSVRSASIIVAALLVLAGCTAPGAPSTGNSLGTAHSPGTAGTTTTVDETPSSTDPPTGTPTPTKTAVPTATDYPNPWRSRTVVVGVDDSAVVGGRNVLTLVEQALAYWNRVDSEYGDYDVEFVLNQSATSPDVVVTFRSDVVCDGSDEAIGCAPVIEYGTEIESRPQTVAVETGYVNETTLEILKHEFGHVLGVDHGEPPLPLMQESTVTTRLSTPNASERLFPWRTRTLDVYVANGTLDKGGVASLRYDQIRNALAFYATDRDDGWIDNVSFSMVDDPADADIAIRMSAEPPCDTDSCVDIYGHDVDGDPPLEYYTLANVTVYTGLPEENIGWHVAFQLAVAFGTQEYDKLPDDLREGDRNGAWWRD